MPENVIRLAPPASDIHFDADASTARGRQIVWRAHTSPGSGQPLCVYICRTPIPDDWVEFPITENTGQRIIAVLSSSPMDSLFQRIRNLVTDADSYDEDEHPPTQDTINRAIEVLRPLADSIRKFDTPSIFPFDGSIHLEWHNQGKLLSFAIPSSLEIKPYLYHHSETPGIIRNPDKATFERWLDWLSKPIAKVCHA